LAQATKSAKLFAWTSGPVASAVSNFTIRPIGVKSFTGS
jgi:hypothetical protein